MQTRTDTAKPVTVHLAGALSITDPVQKAGQTRLLVAGWRDGSIAGLGTRPAGTPGPA